MKRDENSVFARPLPASDTLEKLVAVCAEANNGRVALSLHLNLPHHHFEFGEAAAMLGQNQDYKALSGMLRERAYLEIAGASFGVAGPGREARVRYRREDLATAVFDLGDLQDAESSRRAVQALANHFTLTLGPILEFESLPPIVREGLHNHEMVVAALGAEVGRIGQFALEQAKRNSEHVAEMTQQLELGFQRRRDELDGIHATRLQSLVEREESLKRRETEFDLRANTIVRRDVSNQLRRVLEGRTDLRLSASAARKRRIIHALCWLGMSVGGAGFGVGLYRLFAVEAFDWRLYFPITLGAAVFASTLVYYIRWSDLWFREHAEAEIADRKLLTDTLRAAWLAELVFENKGEARISEALLERFATDLFVAKNRRHARHPAEALEDLVRRLTKVRVGESGVEIEKKPRA